MELLSPEANILTGITSGSSPKYISWARTGDAGIVLDGSNGDFSGLMTHVDSPAAH